MWSSKKNLYIHHNGNSKAEAEGVSKAHFFKGKHDAKLEFLEGWGRVKLKKPSVGSMDIFWNNTICSICKFISTQFKPNFARNVLYVLVLKQRHKLTQGRPELCHKVFWSQARTFSAVTSCNNHQSSRPQKSPKGKGEITVYFVWCVYWLYLE